MVNRSLGRRTAGEDHWLFRRQTKLTQARVAKIFKISERKYNLWETDREEPSFYRFPNPSLGELCALARRRQGWKLRRAAKEFGVTHVTLLRWEDDSDPYLVAGWRSLGYRFPAAAGRVNWAAKGARPAAGGNHPKPSRAAPAAE